MKVQEVVDRVLKDPKFAADLTKKVSQLSSTGDLRGAHNNDVWRDILSQFAENPEELARLSSVNNPIAGSSWWTTSVITVTSAGLTPAAPVTVTQHDDDDYRNHAAMSLTRIGCGSIQSCPRQGCGP